MSLTAQKGKWMIYFTDSQTGWGFSKPSELCWPELGAGVWVTGPHPALGTGARGYFSACPWESLCFLVLSWGLCPLESLTFRVTQSPGGCSQACAMAPGGLRLGSFIFSWAWLWGHSGYICTESSSARAGVGSFPAPRQNLIAWPGPECCAWGG